MLTFCERFADYSLYRRPDGTYVYLGHGTPRTYLIDFDFDIFQDMWRAHYKEYGTSLRQRQVFLETARKTFTDPDEVDCINWCVHCRSFMTEGYSVQAGGWACENCIEDFYCCGFCDEYASSTTEMLSGVDVCDICRSRYYSWCESCDGYYRDGDADEHQHDDDEGNNCCESDAPEFVVRNDGDPLLANDTRVTITLPAGVIDAEGLQRISGHVYEWLLNVDRELGQNPMGEAGRNRYYSAEIVESLGDKWQAKDGNYTKRLSRAIYKQLGLKVPPATLSQVGCIARDHSTSVDFQVETTRQLNMSASDFYHADSCWFQSYYNGRCALKTNGGFALRTFSKAYGTVSGRAWVMPLKQTVDAWGRTQLLPTFETQEPDAFVIFNGYGDLQGYAAARIVSHMAGWTYRKINFRCSPMFVNGDMGYLVGAEEIVAPFTDGSLSLSVEQHANLYHSEQADKTAALAAEKELTNV